MSYDINNKLNPYISSESQGVLHNSVVAFIDILGFKEHVRDAKKKGNSQEIFTKFQDTISNAFSTLDFSFAKDCYEISGGLSDIKNTYNFRIFTDCILIGCPIRKTGNLSTFIEGCDEFHTVLDILYFLQTTLVNSGFFVRGGISVDEFYMDDITIYGVAGIDAYDAESERAKYPRIILTKSAEAMLMKINKGFRAQKRENYIRKYLYKDRDGLFFINYLESINMRDIPFLEHLQMHKEVIEKNLQKHHDKPDILEKYVWAADYHNCFCNQNNNTEYRIDLIKYQM